MLTKALKIKARLKYPGFMIIADLVTDARITKSMRLTMEVRGGRLYCAIQQGQEFGRYKTKHSYYDLTDLDGMHLHKKFNKMTLRFPNSEHMLFIIGDDRDCLVNLKKDIKNSMRRIHCIDNLEKGFTFDPYFDNYLSLSEFKRFSLLNENLLTTLILENIVINTVPVKPLNSPIVLLSLSNTKLGLFRDKFWDWMSMSEVYKTVQILEINSMELESLPFEIMYMTKLHTLSVANNKLTCLPHYVAELKKLVELYIDKNKIRCMPRGLLDSTFRHINYNNNEYIENNNEPIFVDRMLWNEKKQEVMKLSHLSFLSLIYNHVQLNRNDLPSNLQLYFDQFGSCLFCHRLVFNDYTNERIEYFYAQTYNMMTNYIYRLPWLSLECNYPCSRKYFNREPYTFHLKDIDDYNVSEEAEKSTDN